MNNLKRVMCVVVAAVAAATLSSAQSGTLTDEYREVAGRLIGASLVDEGGWVKLEYLTTRIGNRLSGSANLDKALRWTYDYMRDEHLENVTLQPVKVPRWVRGTESARMVAPYDRPLNMLGLGSSVGTPPGGITAPVVVVETFPELEALGAAGIKGKIVVYDVEWKGYGATNVFRTTGASRAAKLGAVASIVRSMTGSSLYTPHTGNQNYEAGVTQIPALAVTVEETALMRRLVAAGQEVRVHIEMEARMMPEVESANIMGEITGRERPDEVVVLGGHIDSWDVGQGAHDDGGGIVAAWQAVTLMKQLGLRPRRTVRIVGWTNEENGAAGGAMYRTQLEGGTRKHVAAIEMDGGAERPLGFGFSITGVEPGSPAHTAAQQKLQQIAKLLEGIGSNTISNGGGGTDIAPLGQAGVPLLGLQTVEEHYFDWHHTNADTLDKVNPQDFRKCIATLAVMAYILADMPGTLK